jgi:putative iron-only hydrogenase system regulator
MEMQRRIAVVGLVIEKPSEVADRVNEVLSKYGHLIVGRMGIPYREKGISIISLIVDGTTDEISSMTGKLGNIAGVKVRSAVTV